MPALAGRDSLRRPSPAARLATPPLAGCTARYADPRRLHGSLRWATMSFQIRPLSRSDRRASSILGTEAFGTAPSPSGGEWPIAGQSPWRTFDGATLAARAFRRAYASWFGGVEVPTNGLAGVTVAAEYRGRGLLRPLIGQVLADGRASGDEIGRASGRGRGVVAGVVGVV